MRQIQNDEPVGLFQMLHGEGPGDHSAPVVSDDHRFLLLEVIDDGHHVAHQLVHGVVLDALGLIALVVAALIDGHDLEVFGQRTSYRQSIETV